MREALAARVGERRIYTARFVRFGVRNRPEHKRDTALLRTVVDFEDGEVVAEHLWLRETDGLRALPRLDPRDLIAFTAVARYYDAEAGMDVELTQLQDVGWAWRRVPRREEVGA